MLENHKVIWREGMFLQPQHFQQADRFSSHNINMRMSCYQHYYFGINELELDNKLLTEDIITLKKCTGIMPDGTYFCIPTLNKVPESRTFAEHFKNDQQYLTIYLGLPLEIEGKENVSKENRSPEHLCRYRSTLVEMTDEVSGSLHKEIELGEPCLIIIFGDESRDGFTTLPIARLKRKADKKIILQEDYIPPILEIGESQYLINQLKSVVDKVVNKCHELSQWKCQKKNSLAEFNISEETIFRLLQALNMYLPLINNYSLNPVIHPYELYFTLMMFAGGLNTFINSSDITKFPSYDHIDLFSVFNRLLNTITAVVEKDISADSKILPVVKTASNKYSCLISDNTLFSNAKFYLGVFSKMSDKELIVSFLQRIKVGSSNSLDLIISSAMPGVPLINVINAPDKLMKKTGYIYFAFETDCELWTEIVETANISFYLPSNYPDLKMEIIALKEYES